MPAFTVEKMALEDMDAVTELARQLGYPNKEQDLTERFLRIQNDSAYGLWVAKSTEKKVLGWIQIQMEPTSLLVPAKAEIAALVVSETSRNQGVGKALVEQAEIWAKGRGVSQIRVRSNVAREKAHRFYLREGYALAKTSCVFTKESEEHK